MDREMFYLRSRHGDTGCNVMFHNKDGRGYGTDLDGLHLFTKDEAQKELDHHIESLPLLKSEVDKLAIRAVDMQYLDSTKAALNPHDSYAIQLTGDYNGNDIYFKCEVGRTYDYSKAKSYTYDEALRIGSRTGNAVIWGKSYLDGIARRTFQAYNISTRKMITGAGIKYKKPRKKKPGTGKTRGNCPGCGKITWDYNPYDHAYCSRYCEP